MPRSPLSRSIDRARFREAVLAVIERRPGALDESAEALVEAAAKGRRWAVRMLADRLDGRPPEYHHHSVEALRELPQSELERIVDGYLVAHALPVPGIGPAGVGLSPAVGAAPGPRAGGDDVGTKGGPGMPIASGRD